MVMSKKTAGVISHHGSGLFLCQPSIALDPGDVDALKETTPVGEAMLSGWTTAVSGWMWVWLPDSISGDHLEQQNTHPTNIINCSNIESIGIQSTFERRTGRVSSCLQAYAQQATNSCRMRWQTRSKSACCYSTLTSYDCQWPATFRTSTLRVLRQVYRAATCPCLEWRACARS